MTFAAPWWLAGGLAACIVLIWLYYRDDRKRRTALAALASSRLLERLTASVSLPRRRAKRTLLLIGVACLFAALARPQAGYRWEETRQKSVDVLFIVDTSKSMLSQDVKPDRLTRAKMAVEDLAEKLDGDRLGLVAFAGDAFLQCPLTLDGDAFRQSVDALDTLTIPLGGTDISSALREARAAYGANGSEGGTDKIVVLLTDGEDLEGSAVDAAKEAAKDGLKIYTIGVGTAAGELIPTPGDNGGTDFVRDASGQIVKSRLDDARLRQIAEATGGSYRPLGARGEGLADLYDTELAALSRDKEADRKVRVPLEQFAWPLGLGLALLLIEPLIGTRRRDQRKTAEPPRQPWLPRSRSGGIGTAATTLLLAFALVLPLRAGPAAGEKAFQKGDYEKAEQEFDSAAKRNPKPELQFDLGSAAYKNQQFDKATDAFQKTLGTDKLGVQEEAYYNLGDARYRIGQQTEQSDKKQTIAAWQQAVEAYEAALKLKPDDADAKFNRDFVKKKLDDLQKKNDKSDEDNKDNKSDKQNQQNQQNPQDKPDSGKQDPQNQPNQKPNPSDQNGQPQNQNQNPGQPKDQNPPQNPSNDPNKPSPNQNPAPKPDQKPPQNGQNGESQKPQPQNGDNQEQGQGQAQPGQMTKDEAKSLLNSLRGEEKKLPMTDKGGSRNRTPEKDW